MTLTLSLIGLICFANVLVWHVQLSRALRASAPPPAVPARYPSITVVRPVRGADVGAEQNFKTAIDTGYPGEVETLFLFDDENDPGLPIALAVAEEHHRMRRPGRVDVLVVGAPPSGRTGKLNAMTFGAARAEGELIAFGDSDTRPDHDVLRVAVETLLSRPQAGCVFAPVVVNEPACAAGDVLYAVMQNAMYSPMAAFVAGPARALPFIMGQLMVFRRSALDAIGGVGVAQGQLVDDMYIGKCLHQAGFENVMSTHPLHIATGGMTLSEFMPVYQRWMLFSKNGLPMVFTWRQWLLGLDFFVALLAFLLALITQHWMGALVPVVAVTAAGLSLLSLQRLHGGAPVPLRLAWAAWAFFFVSPAVLLANLFNHHVSWRGRDYRVDTAAALSTPPSRLQT